MSGSMSWEPNVVGSVHPQARKTRGSKMWLAFAAITLSAALGFCVLAVTVQEFEH